MTQIYTTYEFSKRLKEFLGEAAPEPMEDYWWIKDPIRGRIEMMINPEEGWIEAPAYQLHDLLSKPFCEAMAKKVDKRREFSERITWKVYQRITRQLCAKYWKGGLPAVEKALTKMMEAK